MLRGLVCAALLFVGASAGAAAAEASSIQGCLAGEGDETAPWASILLESKRHLEGALNYSSSMNVIELASSVEALMPVVDVLASFVSKPLRKDSGNLRRAASTSDLVDLEKLVDDERRIAGKRDSVVATSAYWSYLFLDFFERLLHGVMENADAALDESKETDDSANAVIRVSAQSAYDAVYAPQHNFIIRKIARGVLNFIPHRERFFVAFGRSGSERKYWKSQLKKELTSFLGALRPCLTRLRDHFSKDGIPENL